MDKKYSAINDMYGVDPPEEPPKPRRRVWPYVLLGAAVFFVFESLRPVMHLRPDPPRALVGARYTSDKTEYEAQERTAKACWEYAIQFLQERYPFGEDLPQDPPIPLRSPTGKTSAISVLCWPRLRLVWSRKDSWVESYEWSTDWITNPESSFQQTLRALEDFLGISH